MSPQAIADAEEIERFAHDLKAFAAQLQDNTTRLQGQYGRLAETWHDQEEQKFAREFVQTMATLRRFATMAAEESVFLLVKAQQIRAYLTESFQPSAPPTASAPAVFSLPKTPTPTTETTSRGPSDVDVDTAREQGKESVEGGFRGREGRI
jgi:uncharacterized protein YukE